MMEKSSESFVSIGDSVFIDEIQGLWYNRLDIMRNGTAFFPNILLYKLPCQQLWPQSMIVRGQSGPYNFSTPQIVDVLSFQYLLDGSSINFTLAVDTVHTDTHSAQIALLVFNTYASYLAFERHETGSRKDAIYDHNFSLSHNMTTVTFDLPRGYYFAALQTTMAVVFEYSYRINQTFYNNTDYTPQSCSINGSNPSCSLMFSHLSVEKLCIFVYTENESYQNDDPLYLYLQTNKIGQKQRNVIVIAGIVLAGLTAIIIIGLVCILCMFYMHSRKGSYQQLKQDYPIQSV